jgi:hypothetical protein
MVEGNADNATNQPAEDMAERLSFFFSDSNLRSDKFMKNEMKYNHDKCVPIDKLLRFNSIKKVSTDPEVLVKAVETSASLKDFLKLNEKKDGICRVTEFDIHKVKDNIPCTILVKELPVTENRFDVTVDELKAAFADYGKVTLVRMRREKDTRAPKGEAFIEFEDLDMANKVLSDFATVPKQEGGTDADKSQKKMVIKGKEVAIESMTDFVGMKEKQKAERGEGDKKRTNNADEESPEVKDDGEKKNDGFDIVWKEGCVIAIKGFPDECDRESIHEAVKQYDKEGEKILYYDFSRGQKEGAIRFFEFSDKVKELAEKLNKGEIKIKGEALESAIVLEGDEEKKYWETVVEWKRKQRQQRDTRGGGGRGRGGRGRGGRGGGGDRNKRPRYH